MTNTKEEAKGASVKLNGSQYVSRVSAFAKTHLAKNDRASGKRLLDAIRQDDRFADLCKNYETVKLRDLADKYGYCYWYSLDDQVAVDSVGSAFGYALSHPDLNS